jgi:hypothetical protein
LRNEIEESELSRKKKEIPQKSGKNEKQGGKKKIPHRYHRGKGETEVK